MAKSYNIMQKQKNTVNYSLIIDKETDWIEDS